MAKIYAFCDGEAKNLADVPDQVFAEKMLGEGVAIIPDPKKKGIYSPISGEVAFVAESLHAVGIVGEDGKEYLIHIGLETMKLGKKAFKMHVGEGEKVQVGDLLVSVKWKNIEKQGLQTITMLVNSDGSLKEFKSTLGKVAMGDILLEY